MDFADSVSESLDDILVPLHENKTLYYICNLVFNFIWISAKPKLPSVIRQLFDNAIFRVMILSLIIIRKG